MRHRTGKADLRKDVVILSGEIFFCRTTVQVCPREHFGASPFPVGVPRGVNPGRLERLVPQLGLEVFVPTVESGAAAVGVLDGICQAPIAA